MPRNVPRMQSIGASPQPHLGQAAADPEARGGRDRPGEAGQPARGPVGCQNSATAPDQRFQAAA